MISFFDSNILVYMFDRAEPVKQALAIARFEKAAREEKIVLSTQVLHEFVDVTTRKLKFPLGLQDVSEYLNFFAGFEVLGSSSKSVREAISLKQAERLSWWDSLILEAAIRANADVLVSEDFQSGRRFGKLKVENPFA